MTNVNTFDVEEVTYGVARDWLVSRCVGGHT